MAEGDVRIMTAYVQVDAKTEDATKKIDEVKTKVEGIKTPDLDPLDIETKEFNQKVDEASQKSSSFGAAAGDIFKGVADKLTAMGVTMLIQGFINSVNELMSLARDLGVEITEGADKLGISTKSYQVWERVLKRSGGSVNDLAKGVDNINKLLDSANSGEPAKGFEDAAAAFEELGVSAKDADGNLRSTEEILQDTIIKLAQLEDGDKKTDLANRLFGGNDKFNKMLEQGAAGIRELQLSSEKSVLSEKAIESSIRYHDAIESLNTSLEELKTTATTQLLEPLSHIVDAMTDVMNFFNPDNWRDKSVEGQFKAIDESADATAAGIEGTAAQAETFIDKLIELNSKTEKTAQDHAAWQYYADWLIKNIPSLKDVIDKENESIGAEAEVLKESVAQWKERQKALIAQQAMEDKRLVVSGLLSKASDAEEAAIEKEGDAVNKRGEAIEKLNKVLSENPDLQGWWAANHNGETTIGDASLDDMQQLLDYMSVLGKNTGENQSDLLELNQLQEEATKAREAADKAYEEYAKESEKLENYANSVQTVVNKAGEDATSAAEDVAAFGAEVDALPESKTVTIVERIVREDEFYSGGDDDGSHAAGLPSVPYDGYRAILHRGETVLTASQSRREKDGSGGVSVQDLTQALVAAMRGVKFAMDSEVVGGFVAPTVGEQLAASL